jgi:phage minor structural protein
MIPILFEKTETAFMSNGLGRLSDCIRCIVTEERNGIYECEFDYPVTGAMFSEIQEGRIIACTHDEQGDIQPFDIYGRTEPINGIVTFYAHHISYRLNEITVKPFTAGSCAEALLKIKTQSVNPNPFTFQTDKSVTADYVSDVPKNAKGMLAGEQGSILDVFGTGEYEFDKFNVILHLHRGQDTNVSIRYGKNLIDYTNNYDASESYTAVVPYWLGSVSDESGESEQTLVMLPEIFIRSGHSVPSGREVVVPMDLSDVYEEKPSVEALRASATSRLNRSNAWLPNQTVTVDFVQLWQTDEYKDYAVLQRLRLCDTCGVFVPMYDTALRAKVIRTEYNVLLDRYDRMELGDKPTTYTAVMERMYNSKVAGVVAGLQSIAVSVDAVRAYSDGQLSSAVLAINSDIENLQSQIDGNITTWFFGVDPTMSNPPVAYDPNVEGSGWDTTEKKNNHLGDVYYNTANGTAWRFINENGTYSWMQIADSDVSEALRIASEAKDVADAKRRVFYSQPVPPYDDGDLWTQGADGDILRCATPKAEGESFSRSDWILASKYTDNSALNAFISGTFADTVGDIEGQLDQKAETWYQSTDPSLNWGTAQLRQDHKGDLWYYTGNTTSTYSHNATYRWNGSSWQVQTIPSSVFDMIDGKSQIFVGTNTPTGAENGDLWFKGTNEPILTYVNGMWVDYNYYIDATVSQGQADSAERNAKNYADNAVSALQGDLEAQIDAKIETWAQTADPQTGWSDKSTHDGDLWLYTGLTPTTISGTAVKPQGVYQYDFTAGGTLCNESNVDITNENGVVLEANDSGNWIAYASTSKNLFDLADGKSTIYYGSPTGTYSGVDTGDYLVDSSTGNTYRYQGGAWVKQTDYKSYTDNEISALSTSLKSQIDAKIETWAQTGNPASSWTTTALRTAHNGDLWLYTGTSAITVGSVTIKPQGVYKYNANSNSWSAYSSTSRNLFDIADGKSTIFYGSTSGTYANKEVGDYLVDSSTGATYRWNGSSWAKQTDYKTYTDGAISTAKQTIEQQYEQAIEEATELIRGGTGGYVVTTTNANGQPIELLITDNLNLNQAVNVWRWNQGGLAHSSNGYNGPFSDVAITADGKINASRVLTGELTANIVKAGTLTDASNKNSWNLDTGLLSILKGSINLGNGKFVATDAGKVTVKGGGLIQDASDNNSWNLDSGRLVTTSGQIGPFALTDDGLTYEDTSGSVRNYTLIDPTEIVSAQRTRVNGVYETKGVALTESVIQFLGKKNSASAKDYEKVGEISVRISSGTEERYIQYFKLENRTYMTWWGYDSSIPIQIQFTTSIEKDLFVIGTIHNSSDRRLKDHIEYLDKDADEFVRGLKPAHYIKDGEHHTGFYAQDVEDIDKWGGMVGTKGEYKTLAYNDIIAPLVAYCQHLEKRIEELERKNNK